MEMEGLWKWSASRIEWCGGGMELLMDWCGGVVVVVVSWWSKRWRGEEGVVEWSGGVEWWRWSNSEVVSSLFSSKP